MHFALYVICLVAAVAVAWRYLGSYMEAVFDGRVHWLGWLERPTYRLLGVDEESEQSWQRYATSLIIYSGVAILVVYGFERLQGHLPFNPQHLPGVGPALSFNTATSFVTNTNWQNYVGEATMSYLTQMVALVGQQFASAAAGMCVMLGLIRGFSRKDSSTIGNFWVDLVRGVYYILLPIAAVAAIIYVGQGAVQTLAGPVAIHDVLNGVKEILPRGPEGLDDADQAARQQRWRLHERQRRPSLREPHRLHAMVVVVPTPDHPDRQHLHVRQDGEEHPPGRRRPVRHAHLLRLVVRLRPLRRVARQPGGHPGRHRDAARWQHGGQGHPLRRAQTTLFNVASTQTSTGSVTGSNDSMTPIGGMAMLTGMMLGEVSPGGAGAGMYTILAFAIIAVFIGGLMVGRTPEYLGKKIQAREVKLAGLLVLVMPMLVLILTGIAVSVHAGRAGPENGGPHGFTEILYAITSPANNNGSAFAGLNGNTPFYNIVQVIAFCFGRFAEMVPALALGGVLAAKNVTPESAGTFRTDSGLFVGLLTGVILLVGALVFFPAVALGPIVEQLVNKRYPDPNSLHMLWQHTTYRLSLIHGKVFS